MSLKLMNSYYKSLIHDDTLTLTEFIFHFLTDYNQNYNTVDEEGNIQCYSGKHRSLGDITEICKSYYDTDREEVKEILLNFGSDLVGHYCPDIYKRIYELKGIKDHDNWEQQGTYRNDEYDNPIEYRTINLNKQLYPHLYEKAIEV